MSPISYILKRWPLTAAMCLWSAAVGADIRIEISGVNEELRKNVSALLSLERYKDRERIEAEALQRLYRRVDEEVSSALEPFGYYSPTITHSLDQVGNGPNWLVRIQIAPGEPVMVSAVDAKLQGEGVDDAEFQKIFADPPLKVGQQLSHSAYNAYKLTLERTALGSGYFDARWIKHELSVDPAARSAQVFLELDTGARYRFGATTIEQTAVRETLLRQLLRYNEGEPYEDSKRRLTRNALENSLYFAGVDVEVDETTIDREQHIAPIKISAERSRRSYRFGPGYNTNEGLYLTGTVINPHYNDRGHRQQLRLELSEIRKQLDARHEIPIGDPAREQFAVNFRVKREQVRKNSPKISDLSLTPSVSQVLGAWQRVISVDLSRTHESTLTQTTRNTLAVPSLQYASVPEDFLGEDLFSRNLFMELIGSHQVLGADANFIRFRILGERRRDLGAARKWHVLMRGELGFSRVGKLQDLPADFRYFAGGDRSVRGFDLDDLSPWKFTNQEDVNDTELLEKPYELTGSRHLVSGTLEFERDLPGILGLAAFADAGNAVNRLGDALAFSVGLGVRWRLPGITIGLDLAKAIRHPVALINADNTLIGTRQAPRHSYRLHLSIAPRQ